MKNPFSRTAHAAKATPAASTDADMDQTQQIDISSSAPLRANTRRSSRKWPIIAGVTAVAVLGTGAVVASAAHKTVVLDIDGQVSEVTTWRGSVENLLAERQIQVGERDLVAPGLGAALSENSEVVVRYAREITVADNDGESQMWTTAVDADEILETLAARDEDTHLVASRSAERAEIGIRLPADEAVDVRVDGQTLIAPVGLEDVDAALAGTDVTLNDLDRVTIQRLAADGEVAAANQPGTVTVVVSRVEVDTVKKTKKIAYKTVTKTDPNRFSDLPVVVGTKGVKGVRTIKHEVTLVDGAEESRTKLSNKVTTKPVTEVLVKGTKERPVIVTAPAVDAKTGKTSKKAQGKAPTSGVWSKLAQCESGGRVNVVSASGAYHGLYQFSVSTWRGVGGKGLPSQASAAEQTKRAKMLQARSGWGQWPACSSKLGLR